jgi:ABC-2 type transport system permease protein
MSGSRRRRLGIYGLEAKYEFLKQFRLPATIIFGFGFPVAFYVIFGLMFGRQSAGGDVSSGAYYIATYGAFGVISSALYGIGVGMATERSQGWMLLKRASPMPFDAYIVAKVTVACLSAALIVALLAVCGAALLGMRLSPLTCVRLFVIMIAGALPFCTLGLAIGCWAGPNSAVAIVNLINMPMALLSGLWIPFDVPVLPAFVHTIAAFLPAYHYSQLALGVLGAGFGESALGHVLALVGFAILCTALAYAGYRRDEGKTYG